MNYSVLVSKTFQRKFQQLQKNFQNQIRKSLKELEYDPYMSRPNCDIKSLTDTRPKKYRLRVGNFRVIYLVENKEVKVVDLIKREVGYGRLD